MIRIAITGPESSGKTSLAEQLAKHFSADLITEFARTYLEAQDGKYTKSDLPIIASGHLSNIIKSQNSIQIIDTDFIGMKIWSDYRFQNTEESIIELIHQNTFDAHILCTPDIPWEEDPLRENQHDRDVLFELFQQELQAFNKEYIVVAGSHDNRFKESVSYVQALLK